MDAEPTKPKKEPLSPSARIGLRKQIGWLMADDPEPEANVTLEEFGLDYPQPWPTAKKAALLGLTSQAADDTLVGLHRHLLERDTDSADTPDNTKFDVGEQAEIAKWAQDLLEHAEERFNLQGEQLKLLGEQVDELVKASRTIGRKEWYKMALGSFVGISMNHAIETPAAEAIFIAMKATIGHLFGHPVLQLGPGSVI